MLFPPEIFDLIIDAVSSEVEHQPLSELMKTCSLVCRCFHSRARIYLFSQITLWLGMEKCCQKRASKFLRILKYEKNSDLISYIRSVKILVVFRTGTTRKWNPFFPLGSRGLLKLVGVEVNPMKTAFTMFKNAPIEELVIQGTDDRVTRFPYTPTSCTLLLEICSNPNLKTLCFDNIECISSNFIQGSGHARSLTRLVLREVRLMTEY